MVRRNPARGKGIPTESASEEAEGSPPPNGSSSSCTKNPEGEPASEIKALPDTLSVRTTKLGKDDHATLLKKQNWLKHYTLLLPKDLQRKQLSNVIDATLVFAQEEAGTAVCISPEGLLLTCSHCIAESKEEYDETQTHWLLFASGRVVTAQCIAWDAKRDLALLRITSAQGSSSTTPSLFPHIHLSPATPAVNSRLVCVGHPGSEDLEANVPGVQTNYDTLVLSTGLFRGHAPGRDLQDNSEIGALMHSCWTYWGHSGAPLMERTTGRLVGLHSSWDEGNGMRRGVPLEAIRAFLAGSGHV